MVLSVLFFIVAHDEIGRKIYIFFIRKNLFDRLIRSCWQQWGRMDDWRERKKIEIYLCC